MNYKKYWYNNTIIETKFTEQDTIPEGFVRGRLKKPKKIDFLKTIISKEELYKKFVIENKSYVILMDELNLSRKDLTILLRYYGIKKGHTLARKNNHGKRTHDNYVAGGVKSSITQKEEWKNKSEQETEAWSKKCSDIELNLSKDKKDKKAQQYKDWWLGLSEEERSSINKKRSETLKEKWNNEEIKKSLLDTMKQTEKENRKDRLCRSVSEQRMFDRLIELYEDTKYDVRVDDRYPFFVDFYVPQKDLFIELNAHPSHGRLPIEYLSVDEYSKYKADWVDVFARRDVEKYNVAKQNNLNYIRIYPKASLNENLLINNDNELVPILYQTQK